MKFYIYNYAAPCTNKSGHMGLLATVLQSGGQNNLLIFIGGFPLSGLITFCHLVIFLYSTKLAIKKLISY